MRTAKNILESKLKPYNTVSPDTLVIDALSMLNPVNLSYLVVMEKDEYRGIFSERDYTRNLILKGLSSRDTPVSKVMTVDVPIVRLFDTVEHCMNVMNTYKTRYLLVYDANDHFNGIITIHDLLREVLANKEDVFDHHLTRRLMQQDYQSIF